MGMQQKLNRAYSEGFTAGKKEAAHDAEIRGMIKGAHETFDLIEKMFLEIDGIGPKTKEKIMKAIQAYAQAEKRRLR